MNKKDIKECKKNTRKIIWIMRISFITCLISVVVMGCQKEVVIENPISYYFSEDLGFQENDGQRWQEMAEDGIVIQNNDKTVTIQNVFWVDEEVIFEAQLENYLRVSELEDTYKPELGIKLYAEEQKQTMEAHSTTSEYSEDNKEVDHIIMWFKYKNALEEYSFDIFGEKYTVKMQPIKEYASLEDIGYVQTHKGRSIIVRDDETERKAYTYSNDIWKIVGLEDIESLWQFYASDEETRKNSGVPKVQWSSFLSIDNNAFICIDKTIKDSSFFEIPAVRLKAVCEDLEIMIDLPEEKSNVNIPFFIGEDEYRIYEIEVKPGYYDSDKTIECIEIYFKIENVKVEKSTKLYSVQATLGFEEEVKGYWYDSATGKTEERVIGTRFNGIGSSVGLWENHFFTENYDEMEPVFCVKVDKNSKLHEKMILKIEEAYKIWNQSFEFEIK